MGGKEVCMESAPELATKPSKRLRAKFENSTSLLKSSMTPQDAWWILFCRLIELREDYKKAKVANIVNSMNGWRTVPCFPQIHCRAWDQFSTPEVWSFSTLPSTLKATPSGLKLLRGNRISTTKLATVKEPSETRHKPALLWSKQFNGWANSLFSRKTWLCECLHKSTFSRHNKN